MAFTNHHNRTEPRREHLYFVHVEADKTNTKPPSSFICQETETYWSLHTGLMHNWHLKYNSNKTSRGLSSNSGGEDICYIKFYLKKML